MTSTWCYLLVYTLRAVKCTTRVHILYCCWGYHICFSPPHIGNISADITTFRVYKKLGQLARIVSVFNVNHLCVNLCQHKQLSLCFGLAVADRYYRCLSWMDWPDHFHCKVTTYWSLCSHVPGNLQDSSKSYCICPISGHSIRSCFLHGVFRTSSYCKNCMANCSFTWLLFYSTLLFQVWAAHSWKLWPWQQENLILMPYFIRALKEEAIQLLKYHSFQSPQSSG